MFVKTVATIARFSLLVLPMALAASVNCGSSNDSGTGKGGSGGSSAGTAGSSAGTTGTGGSSAGTGGTGTAKDCTVAAATATDMTILDFSTAIAAGMAPSFGGYMAGTYGGGTYDYPDKALAADQMGLTSTFDGMTWHITGLVKDYSGFGLYLTSVTDASMFGGLSFDISGTFTAAGAAAAPATGVTMTVTDTPHEVDSLHTSDGRMTCGSCMPTATEYDGSCASGSKAITFNGTAATQTVHWTDLTGGRRPPSFTGESPNPAKIDAIAWSLPWSGAGSATYTVDITIDNIKYISP
jgi:hypothetical protein